jgi:hypothetical protein
VNTPAGHDTAHDVRMSHHDPELLYMLEHPELRLRRIGVTVSHPLPRWVRRGWTVLETLSYWSTAELCAEEATALHRLDQFDARSSTRMETLFPNLHPDGRCEMFDPLCFRGTLRDLLSSEIGEKLHDVDSVRPPWIPETLPAAAINRLEFAHHLAGV